MQKNTTDSYDLIETFFTTLAAVWLRMELTTGLASKPHCVDSILAQLWPIIVLANSESLLVQINTN